MIKIRTQSYINSLKTKLCLNHFNSHLLTLVEIEKTTTRSHVLIFCRNKAIAYSLQTKLKARKLRTSLKDAKLLSEWNIPNKGKNKIRWILVLKECNRADFEWLLSQDLNEDPPKTRATFKVISALPLAHHAALPMNKPALALSVGCWARIIPEASGGDSGKIGIVESVSSSGAVVKLGGVNKFFLWWELKSAVSQVSTRAA